MDEENPYSAPQSDVSLPPPLPDDGRMELASLGSRFAGALIDGIIMVVITVVSLVVVFVVGGVEGTEEGLMEMADGGVLTIAAVLLAYVGFIVLNWYPWSKRGQSLGKMALKIKIVRTDGSKASMGRIVGLRLIVIGILGMLPFVGSIISLIDPLLIFRQERNCLHDDIADTRVIIAR